MIHKWTDRNYLVRDQYRDACHLEARIQIYAYATGGAGRAGWFRWLFDHYRLPKHAQVLELGCGPGTLWRENLDRIPPGWEVTLADLSPGMLDEARANLADSGRAFAFDTIDAQAIPRADGSLDAVIANHMLYHVPDITRALSEIRRVLRPEGRLYASTVGPNHLRELKAAIMRIEPSLTIGPAVSAFDLSSGDTQLSACFDHVTVDRLAGELRVTDAEPIVTYVGSGSARLLVESERRADLIAWAENETRDNGAVVITTESGTFEAW